jgi:hypothetical protein
MPPSLEVLPVTPLESIITMATPKELPIEERLCQAVEAINNSGKGLSGRPILTLW